MRTVGREPFDRGNGGTGRSRYWCLTGSLSAPSHLYCARTALADTAAELCALEIHDVSEYPEQRHVSRDVDRRGLPVDVECERHVVSLSESDRVGTERTATVIRRDSPRKCNKAMWVKSGIMRVFQGNTMRWLTLLTA